MKIRNYNHNILFPTNITNMSSADPQLRPVLVRDPRTDLTSPRDYAILKAGSFSQFKQWTTTSVSASQITFSCPPPSGSIIVDRKIYLTMPIRLTLTGTSTATGQVLLNADQDAPRAFPISSSIDTLSVSINNQSVSIQMADIIQAMLHYHNDTQLTEKDYSMTPSQLDQSQQYSSLFGSVRSPMASYGDSVDQSVMSRGGFPFTIVSQNTSTGSGQNLTSVVDFVVSEPLFLSPLFFGKGDSMGFYNVNTMDFTMTFLSQTGNRMWSHDATSVGVALAVNNVAWQFNGFASPAFSYAINQPILNITYITPQEEYKIPYDFPLTYPYFEVVRFPTDSNSAIAPAQPPISLISNNIQLSGIPRKIYVFARSRNTDLYSSPSNTDTFLAITGVTAQFQNYNGLFSSASAHQLYEMSVKNGCNMSWTQWSGGPVYNPNLSATYGTIGSVLCIMPGPDIGLASDEAPGKLGQYTFQINVNVVNKSSVSITPTLYVVVVYEGTFVIKSLGQADTKTGVISSSDILGATPLNCHSVSYKDVMDVNGGNFLSGLKDFGRTLLSGVKDVNAFLREHKPISTLTGLVPHPGAQIASSVAKSLGYGDGVYAGCCDKGGIVTGGKSMSRSELRRRIGR